LVCIVKEAIIMSIFAVNENYIRMDARELCTRTLKAYISTAPEKVDQWASKFANTMFEDQLTTKETSVRYLQVMLDGLKYGNWPEELVA
jgi:phage-related minor tail protein